MTADATVTPYDVEGELDYEKLLDRFGADELTDDQIDRFPDPPHPLVRRRVFYAERDLDPFLAAAERGETHSIVTGLGPSGPLHIGHVFPFYFAKHLQERTGAHVYVPVSDDEKYFTRGLSFDEVRGHLRENLRDLLAVGFDPDRTRIVIDTADAGALYPHAASFASDITQATVDATYGEPGNVGTSFYPAMQATHLLLPQLVHGEHPTLVPIAVDQDPHVRVCRDVAAKEKYDVRKPGALLSKFLPGLTGPGKMSSSDDAPSIYLTDDHETVERKVERHAYSGGRESLAEHREHGGDPEVDVAFRYLRAFFEDDDAEVARLAREYRSGELLSGEMKAHAIDRIAEFLDAHQRRREALGDLRDELEPYRLTADERERLRPDPLG
ncbi:tryptophan--tRNA ligase [Halostella sp. JP-L12]|uniref:tryptophan--tRNA ligase n=1 Tax=Halostella TaxID=1843185 RepID=UPI000EF7DBB1|nr:MULTISPECIES: tryptophan--tRNA ligase [Halostella]NHN46015.1 tryptophan--tRNA ligase [Halostella sp. JP-L12]